ncbi:hypothetical protein PAXINDRAFT_16914 [Paxillus involutus ATCC 200175]|uniref:Uncharacterized protein n=1 Tax=Paxillus involutus ATCC 200175 TaxID=664439 RepID=A0A0C9SR01_PAXIN|nr:hypothetical protein PAXINDRAFT_16914 [Paxillus involutus ATCC 200175]
MPHDGIITFRMSELMAAMELVQDEHKPTEFTVPKLKSVIALLQQQYVIMAAHSDDDPSDWPDLLPHIAEAGSCTACVFINHIRTCYVCSMYHRERAHTHGGSVGVELLDTACRQPKIAIDAGGLGDNPHAPIPPPSSSASPVE